MQSEQLPLQKQPFGNTIVFEISFIQYTSFLEIILIELRLGKSEPRPQQLMHSS